MTEAGEAEERRLSPLRLAAMVATGLMCFAITHNALTGQEGRRRETVARLPAADLETSALGQAKETGTLEPRLTTRKRVNIPEAAVGKSEAPGADATLAAGVQKALADLHLYEGQVNGTLSPELKAAIQAYEATHGFDVTGRPSQALLDHLQLAIEIARAAEFDTAAGAE